VDDVLVVAIVDHGCVAGPSTHLLDDEIWYPSDEQVGGATGPKRMPRVVFSREPQTLGD